MKRFFEIMGREIVGLHEAAYLLAFFAFLSQLIALVRDKLLAYHFGAGHILDIYYSAFRIPDIIFVSIASLVSASVLVPFFIDKFNNDTDKGRRFIDSIFSVFFAAIVIVSAIAYLFIPYFVELLLPGFTNDPSLPQLIFASRVLLLSPIFLGLSNFLSSITQMHKRFLVYALSPIVYNFGIVIGIIVFYPLFGFNGLIYGVVVGAFLHMAIQIPFILHKETFPRLTFNVAWVDIKKVVGISLPRTLALSSNQLASFFLVSLASFMTGGSISIFSLAYNLQSVPLSIIGVSYSSAVFPTLSKYFVEKDRVKFLELVVNSARHIVFWSIPITILFIVLRAQIVRTIYGAGQFDWADTSLTAATLAIFIVSVIGQSLVLLFVRAYYAVGKTNKPLYINVASGILIVVFGYLLTKVFFAFPFFRFFLEDLFKVSGQNGTSVLILPLAFSIGVLFNTLCHWFVFEKDYPGFSKPVIATLFQSFSASVIMGYATFVSLRFFNIFFPLTKAWNVFLQGFFAGITGIIIGILILIILKNRELKEIWLTFHQRVWKTNVVVPNQETM